MSATDTTQRQPYKSADHARLAADWVDAQPWPDGVEIAIHASFGPNVMVRVIDEETFHRVRRIIGGRWEKKQIGSQGYLNQRVADGQVDVDLDFPSSTCERVKVGTKTVDVYETRCPDSLLAGVGAEAVPA